MYSSLPIIDHFYHKNILKYQPDDRPFTNIEEMNEEIIKRHNSIVKPTSTYFHLGDFAFTSVKNTHKLLDKLNGKKHFILGNHDRQLRDKSIIDRNDVVFVRHYYELNLKAYGYKDHAPVVLFHFPIENWNRKHYGSYHLHGHEHCGGAKVFNRLDVGVDGHNLTPWSLEEVMDYFDSDVNGDLEN